ncbi:MAG: hypothetical protein JOZ27_08860, partial [Caulobacteraceae bacterium]|nr:hypothetical protein [Caulobacteraceae bacterium]
GYAAGADRLAARAWRDAALGPVHAVFPFLNADRRFDARVVDTATWLDGEATRAGGRHPHLAQTRWLIGAADLLVVIWSGAPARGPGGTADAVRLALEHGVPVLWIDPARPKPRLIRAQALDEDVGFLELLETLAGGGGEWVEPATPETLHRALAELGLGGHTHSPAPPEASRRRHRAPSAGVAWPWRAYALFRRVLGGRPEPYAPHGPPADLAATPGFGILTEAYEAADARARRLGAIHRSHQVILLIFAILAAAAGSASALWPGLKLAMVSLELGLAGVALLVWIDAERARRHHAWGEARKLAEDLRLERAAWALGLSTTPHGPNGASGAFAGDARRLAGLPSGDFDPARVAAWGDWVMAELVGGQVAYHAAQARVNGRISHRLHLAENASFAVLLAVLVGYLVTAILAIAQGEEVAHWAGGLVIMAGAIVPAIGAAGLALEATLGLGEEAQRSKLLAEQLARVARGRTGGGGLEELQRLARAAIRLQRAQEDHWTEGAARRRLFRGG